MRLKQMHLFLFPSPRNTLYSYNIYSSSMSSMSTGFSAEGLSSSSPFNASHSSHCNPRCISSISIAYFKLSRATKKVPHTPSLPPRLSITEPLQCKVLVNKPRNGLGQRKLTFLASARSTTTRTTLATSCSCLLCCLTTALTTATPLFTFYSSANLYPYLFISSVLKQTD